MGLLPQELLLVWFRPELAVLVEGYREPALYFVKCVTSCKDCCTLPLPVNQFVSKAFISQHYLTPEQVNSLLTNISSLEGFVECRDSVNARRIISALPAYTWRLPPERESFDQTIAEIERQWKRFTGTHGSKAGGIFGSIFYEAGDHTVAGLSDFHTHTGPATPSFVGYAGLYLWQLTIPDAPSTDLCGDASLDFHPNFDYSLYEQILALTESPSTELAPFAIANTFCLETPEDHYLAGVRRVLDYIHAGDCYQVNLSNKYSGRFRGEPYLAFRELVSAVPVPYAAYLNIGDAQVLCISPELFLSIQDRKVMTKPIKGTRPRDHTGQEADHHLAKELASASKDRAENLMIVDLLRNDLSRFCEPFSVKVTRLFNVESYQNVHQLVSTVEGILKKELSPLRAMLAAFPGGSITGAPKRRAMEIIRELEPHSRGPYCGTIFRWNFQNNLESNIAIRTLMTRSDGSIHCWAGCGIVADSDPQEEYQESVTKVRKLMDVLQAM